MKYLLSAAFYISLRAQIYPARLFLKIAAYNTGTAVSINFMQEESSGSGFVPYINCNPSVISRDKAFSK